MTMRIVLILLIPLLYTSQLYSEDKDKASSEPIYTVVGTSEKKSLTSFPGDEQTKKIIKRHKIEDEGWFLSKQGLYEEAIAKFRAAMDPSLINYEHEKSTAKWSIEKIYKRQGKFEQALQMIDEKLKSLPPQVANDNIFTGNDWLSRERLELIALIKARDTKDNKSIYEYIEHIKTTSKYAKFIPPKGYIVGASDSRIDDLIHLYDYMHDYDAGIAFMDEIIKYHTHHPDKNHRSAHSKDVKEYIRVKQAWELDKQTGQHEHLEEVIRTSDVISW